MGPDGAIEDAHVVLRFYAWWEHPLYLAARAAGRPWGFRIGDEAERDMRIEAVASRECWLSPGRDATDIAFHTAHPSLWGFEERADIICSSDVDARALLAALMKRNLPGVTRPEDLAGYLAQAERYQAPFSLGPFPRSLFGPVHEELQRMGVATFVSREPSAGPDLVRLEIGDSIVIVAEDFILDVPEFEHRPEWFQPP